MITLGSQYFRAPTPAEKDWDRDVKQAREYGLDTLRCWLMWNEYSRGEGQYDFSSLHRLLDTFDKYDVKAVMLLNLESCPAWLPKKYPEAIYRDEKDGLYRPESVGNTPGGGFPGMCFHHDGVREAGMDYVRAIASEFRDHPAIECWEPHNEPMFEPGRYNDRIYSYDDASIAAFRVWLEKQYGQLDALNANWRRHYGEWNEIEPPRRRGMYNDWMDWRLFWVDTLIETLEWRIQLVRENDPNHYVMIHTRGGSGVTRNLAKEGIDDYRMARLVDKYGTAAFPQCGPEHEYFIAMTGARCASEGKEFWMAELQSGPYGMGVHRNDAEPVCEFTGRSTMEATIDVKSGAFDPGDVSAERLSMWSWSGIAQGAKGILYWQYRNESFGLEYGFGLTELDGSPHDRLRAVKAFRDTLEKHEDLFDAAELPTSRIAMAWDPRNDVINWTAVESAEAVKKSIKGIHQALWHCDYTLDIVRLDSLVVETDFSAYDRVYLPFSPHVSSDAVERLKTYVRNGGTLVAEASIGQFDDTLGVCSVVPGNGLDELFGCRRKDIRTMHVDRLPAIRIGDLRLKNRMHKETLEPVSESARVIGTFETGEPAVIENAYGKGRAIYIGSNPFLSYNADGDPALRDWVHELNAGIPRPVYTDQPDVIARMLIGNDRRIVFVMNTLAEPTRVSTCITGADTPDAITEITTERNTTFEPCEDGIRIADELGPYGTCVYVL